MVVEPKLQNSICRTQKERTKSKIWALYLKNWASYGDFQRSRYDKISFSPNLQMSIYLVEILRYESNFLHVIITFIGFKITFRNIRSHGAPLFIFRGLLLAPLPRVFDPRPDLGFKRVKIVTCYLVLNVFWAPNLIFTVYIGIQWLTYSRTFYSIQNALSFSHVVQSWKLCSYFT